MKFVDYRVEDNIAHVVMNRAPVAKYRVVDEILRATQLRTIQALDALCWKVASQKPAQVWI